MENGAILTIQDGVPSQAKHGQAILLYLHNCIEM
jgi:hypothetical protein